jgi:hypothetical protein
LEYRILGHFWIGTRIEKDAGKVYCFGVTFALAELRFVGDPCIFDWVLEFPHEKFEKAPEFMDHWGFE